MDFITTKRGGRALCAEGYTYHLKRTGTDRVFWRCRHRSCTRNADISSATHPNIYELIELHGSHVTQGPEITSSTPHDLEG